MFRSATAVVVVAVTMRAVADADVAAYHRAVAVVVAEATPFAV